MVTVLRLLISKYRLPSSLSVYLNRYLSQPLQPYYETMYEPFMISHTFHL